VIPTVIVLGLVIGFAPRPWFYLLSLLAGVGWAVLGVIIGTIDADSVSILFGAFMFGAVNTMIGATVTRIVVPLVSNAIRRR
jgi:hypothetical protein